MNTIFRATTIVLFWAALATLAHAQQPQPLPPGSYYQPAYVVVPKWHSGPFRILWWRSYDAYQEPVPQQFQPQPRQVPGPVQPQARQMPATLRAVETPAGYVDTGKPQTFQPFQQAPGGQQ